MTTAALIDKAPAHVREVLLTKVNWTPVQLLTYITETISDRALLGAEQKWSRHKLQAARRYASYLSAAITGDMKQEVFK